MARETRRGPVVRTGLRGRWLDVNLTLQIMTAYEGATAAVKSFLVSSGRPGWVTPVGTFQVLHRVANETMDGATLIGQGPGGAGDTYHITDVLWTQYFDPTGDAIHDNYWKPSDSSAFRRATGASACAGPRRAGCGTLLRLARRW
jgi:lipoprotein-anchoring transpeptidase ErfK/SrfK